MGPDGLVEEAVDAEFGDCFEAFRWVKGRKKRWGSIKEYSHSRRIRSHRALAKAVCSGLAWRKVSRKHLMLIKSKIVLESSIYARQSLLLVHC